MIARQSVKVARLLAALVLVVFMLGADMAPAGAASLPAGALESMEKGLAAARSEDFKSAVRHFEEARKAAPYAPEPLFNLGLAESKIPGRELVALTWFKAFLAADPDNIQARKVRELCGQLNAAAQEAIGKLIDLELKVLGRLRESGWRDSAFLWMVTYRLRLGDLAAARRIADSAGSMKGMAYYRIAQYLSTNGDFEGAMKTADLAPDKGYLYLDIAVDRAGRGDVAGALKATELARRSGRNDFGAVMDAMAVRGDVEGVMKTAEAVGIKDTAFHIVKAQVKNGDVKGAIQTAQRGGLSASSKAYGYIAGAQARSGDIRGAAQTAERVDEYERPAREFAYRNIALAQALKGDFGGARKAAAQIPPTYQKITDSHEKNGTEWIEAVIALLPAKSSGVLGERANVLLNSRTLAGILNSPSHPWLADLPAYLRSFDTTDEPVEIEAGVRRALMGRIEKYMGEESETKKGGMVTLFLRVRDLDKPDND
jgi:tetratricopeptide (TPR) repeat protein